ncbi:hypothetical protein AOLI_G00215630 [Acnodon oligacanthus]
MMLQMERRRALIPLLESQAAPNSYSGRRRTLVQGAAPAQTLPPLRALTRSLRHGPSHTPAHTGPERASSHTPSTGERENQRGSGFRLHLEIWKSVRATRR